MEEFLFYLKLGFNHVLDLGAYDHILFLSALTIPFTFKNWKKVVLLATVFTITHCLSLMLSVYEIVVIDVSLIEFLIPVTIFLTAVFNIFYDNMLQEQKTIVLHLIATAFFGLVHGFGFSNYFKMLVSGEEEKVTPLIGFAGGIELSQILIVLVMLVVTYLVQHKLKVKQSYFIWAASILVLFITIPLLYQTFPW